MGILSFMINILKNLISMNVQVNNKQCPCIEISHTLCISIISMLVVLHADGNDDEAPEKENSDSKAGIGQMAGKGYIIHERVNISQFNVNFRQVSPTCFLCNQRHSLSLSISLSTTLEEQ